MAGNINIFSCHSLIVISSSDHQSNNSSDQYQQAFYVAETGLIQAEKSIIKHYMGEFIDPEKEAENLKAAYDNGKDDDELTSDQKADLAKAYENFVGTEKFEEDFPDYYDGPAPENIAGYAGILQGQLTGTTIDGTEASMARNRIARSMPRNISAPLETDCKRSFKNIRNNKCVSLNSYINYIMFYFIVWLVSGIFNCKKWYRIIYSYTRWFIFFKRSN